MIKYNTLFKQQVIEFYLQNGKNRSLIRKHFQLTSRTLRHWINQFNHSGINGIGYQNILRENGIQLSISRKGNYLDNNAIQSFFERLKTVLCDKRFETFKQ